MLLLSQLRTQLCELTSTEHAPAEDCGHSRGGAAWGFPYPHETRTKHLEETSKKNFGKRSGAVAMNEFFNRFPKRKLFQRPESEPTLEESRKEVGEKRGVG